MTIDIDLAATGNVPFYAPYEVALSDGAYLRVLKTWNLNVTRATAYSRVAGTVGNWWMHLQPGGGRWGSASRSRCGKAMARRGRSR